MKLIISLFIILSCLAFNLEAGSFGHKTTKTKNSKTYTPPRTKKIKDISTSKTKKKGIGSKIIDAGARGYGWQIGKEWAKATINRVKSGYSKIKGTKDTIK